ncbi:hypothetical protein LXT21_35240 [Myxococcus sp. K38C18041901]|uniref:hypothetical protein n=1 Tax=Myxococcus guangdongensis TaxID=2906760 RepID=UPI0020A7C12B|nr:hypothetical protein [Myxococcus guangdongensis]MCP3064045.1 hypothetical protein [Myxococcus guangdongensis]
MKEADTSGRWLIEQAVRRLVADWSSRDEQRRPHGTWVLLWGPIESNAELEGPTVAVPLLAAWFLTGAGFVRQDVWRYLRHRALRYSARFSPLATDVGVLEVALYRGGTAVYAAGHLGPRDAHGLRLERDSDGRLFEQRIWVA